MLLRNLLLALSITRTTAYDYGDYKGNSELSEVVRRRGTEKFQEQEMVVWNHKYGTCCAVVSVTRRESRSAPR